MGSLFVSHLGYSVQKIPAELYFHRISHMEFRNFVKIPRNSVEIFQRNKIPRNSVKNSAEFRENSGEIPWKITWKIPAEFLEKFWWNSVLWAFLFLTFLQRIRKKSLYENKDEHFFL